MATGHLRARGCEIERTGLVPGLVLLACGAVLAHVSLVILMSCARYTQPPGTSLGSEANTFSPCASDWNDSIL